VCSVTLRVNDGENEVQLTFDEKHLGFLGSVLNFFTQHAVEEIDLYIDFFGFTEASRIPQERH
jgi:hypothetical protein